MKTSLPQSFDQRYRRQQSQVSASANPPSIKDFGLSLAQRQDINRQLCQTVSFIPLLDDRSSGKTSGSQLGRIAIGRGGDVHLQAHASCMMGQRAKELLRWTEDSLCALNVETHDTLRSGFDLGRKLGSAIHQGVLRSLLLLGHSLPQNDVRALGRLGLGYPRLYPCKLRSLVACKDARQRIWAIKDCNRAIAPRHASLLWLATDGCLDNKARHENAGKKHD
jgi:hypothetical protein